MLDDVIIEKLSRYPVIILEPRNIEKEDLIKLKKYGAIVYGYTSIVEQNPNNLSFKNISEECFYRADGKKMKNHKWDSYYMDIRQEKYQNFLINEIESEIIEKGFDGLFLDTVGDIDDSSWNEYDKLLMRRSYSDFLKMIKSKHRNLSIIQNWGFDTASSGASKFIDGIMWEGFSYKLLESDQWSINKFREIDEMNIDFYIVSRQEEEIKQLKKRKTYMYVHDSDIYTNI